MMSVDERILKALSNGPMSSYDLARKVWPPDKRPQAWNYQANGGPPAWELTLGKVVKRLRLRTWHNGRTKMVSNAIKTGQGH